MFVNCDAFKLLFSAKLILSHFFTHQNKDAMFVLSSERFYYILYIPPPVNVSLSMAVHCFDH